MHVGFSDVNGLRNRIQALNSGWTQMGVENADRLVRRMFRKPKLKLFDNYLDNTQYLYLREFNELDFGPDKGDVRKCQPKTVTPLPRIATKLFVSHITTEESRLMFIDEKHKIQDDINDFIEDTDIWSVLESALPSYFANGSMFIRFYHDEHDSLRVEWFNTMFVYPTFNPLTNELESVKIRYIYDTERFNDSTGEAIYHWYQYELFKDRDILYDEVVFDKNSQHLPTFTFQKENVDYHNCGFVQGEWVKTSISMKSHDGESFLCDSLDFLDDLNYMSSKQSASIFYNLFPWLAIYGMSKSEIENQISIFKNMGAEMNIKGAKLISTNQPPDRAAISFLESSMQGVGTSFEYLTQSKQMLQYIFNIVLLDPERVAAHAQSGRAMEALFRPVVQFVKQRRPFLKRGICNLLRKMELMSNKKKTRFQLPIGTIDECQKKWGNIYTDTVQDIAQRVNYTNQSVTGGIISKETALKHVAQDFNVEDVQKELKMIEDERAQEMENEMLNYQDQASIDAQNQPKPNQPKQGGK